MQEPRLSRRLRLPLHLVGVAILLCVTADAQAGRRFQPASAPAQPAGPPQPGPNEQPNQPPISLGELNRLFEAYAVIQAQDFLKLTEDQYPDFVARLKALQDARRRHQQNRNRIVNDLGKMLRAPDDQIDDKAVKATLDSLDREDETGDAEIKKAFAGVEAVLDGRQRARFRVFEEHLERRKIDLLTRVQRPIRRMQAPPPSTK